MKKVNNKDDEDVVTDSLIFINKPLNTTESLLSH